MAPEDPTRAALAFFLAKGAVDAGHKPEVVLAGDAAVLAPARRRGDRAVGIPPLKELIQVVLENRVPVYT